VPLLTSACALEPSSVSAPAGEVVQPQRLRREVADDERRALAPAVDVERHALGLRAERVRDLRRVQAADLIVGEHVGGDERLIDAAVVRDGGRCAVAA
jgi:hypothetical protein